MYLEEIRTFLVVTGIMGFLLSIFSIVYIVAAALLPPEAKALRGPKALRVSSTIVKTGFIVVGMLEVWAAYAGLQGVPFNRTEQMIMHITILVCLLGSLASSAARLWYEWGSIRAMTRYSNWLDRSLVEKRLEQVTKENSGG